MSSARHLHELDLEQDEAGVWALRRSYHERWVIANVAHRKKMRWFWARVVLIMPMQSVAWVAAIALGLESMGDAVLLAKWPASEVELARPVVAWLDDLGWEDIVARRGPVLWVVEVKRTLGLTLLGQAHAWKRRAHRVSVAVPVGRNTTARRFALHAAESEGIGIIEAWKCGDVKVSERTRPQLRRRVLGFKLIEAQKTWAEAGNASGKRWSPFQETCKLVREVVEGSPGLTIREVVESVDHHYASTASARGSLLQWAREGALEGVVAMCGTKETGHYRLYPAAWQGPIAPRRPR